MSFQKLAAYAYNHQEIGTESFHLGEGLVGQCALENRMMLLDQVPNDYIKITSGTGMASPIRCAHHTSGISRRGIICY